MAALQEKKSCSQRMEEFQRYCWNPDTGQMLGRTLSRWGACVGKGTEGPLRERPRTASGWAGPTPGQASPPLPEGPKGAHFGFNAP